MVLLVHTVCSIICPEVHLKLQIMVDIYIYMYYTGVTGAYYIFCIMLTSKDILYLTFPFNTANDGRYFQLKTCRTENKGSC